MTHDEAVAIARGIAKQLLDAIEAEGAQSVGIRREQNGAMQSYDITLQTGVKVSLGFYGLDIASMRTVNEAARQTKPPIHLVVPAISKKRSRRA